MPIASYETLLTETSPQVIETEVQYRTIGQRFGDLAGKGRARTPEETKLMRLLALLIEDYDGRHAMPPDDSTAAERLQFLLEHSGKTPSDSAADLRPAERCSRSPDRNTPAQREEIRSKMMRTPQHVMVSAFEGMFALQAPKPGETYDVPVAAIMVKRSQPGYESQLKAIFPKLSKFEEWEGSGHFLMMESPDRFNSSLQEFLAGLK